MSYLDKKIREEIKDIEDEHERIEAYNKKYKEWEKKARERQRKKMALSRLNILERETKPPQQFTIANVPRATMQKLTPGAIKKLEKKPRQRLKTFKDIKYLVVKDTKPPQQITIPNVPRATMQKLTPGAIRYLKQQPPKKNYFRKEKVIKNMNKYINQKVNLTEKQQEKIKVAYQNNLKVGISFKPEDMEGSTDFYFTKGQIDRMNKAFNNGKCININLSKAQIGFNLKHGGFLGALARIGASVLPRLLPAIKPLGKAFGVGASTALGDKAVRGILGNGLFLGNEGRTARIETDGSGLYLSPVNYSFPGSGVFLVQDGQAQDGSGILTSLPIVGDLLKVLI